jgi:trk system potassium uptake protein TrkA
VKITIIGAGQVGTTIVEALHDEHELTVVDIDEARLEALSHRYDVTTFEGNGSSRRALQDAGVGDADLLIACTSRDEANLVAAILARKIAPDAKTIVRTTETEYLELWQERQLDVDFIVSSELETAHAVSTIIGIPAARQTDVFAEGQVQIVEFDVEDSASREAVGQPLRNAAIPRDSKVAAIIRGERMFVPRGDDAIEVSDRIIVIGTPQSARRWSRLIAGNRKRVDDVVIFGGGRTGTAIAGRLIEERIRVRIVEVDARRALYVAKRFPAARVFHAKGLDPEFIERERIANSRAAIFAMRDDAKNHYGATLAKLHGVGFTIAIAHDAVSQEVFHRAGINVSINPRVVTAEEIVRHAHDPRTQQVAMFEGDRYEILDVTVRDTSKLVHRPFRELPMTGALIGAVVRDGKALIPHGEDELRAGDRAIIFTESSRATEVERAL